MEPSGLWPVSTPFYSTFLSPQAAPGPQVIEANGEVHELSLYHDTYRIITTALAALALSEQCSAGLNDCEALPPINPHARYSCPSHSEYVAKFALRPYSMLVPQ